jgi:hypothetical protein
MANLSSFYPQPVVAGTTEGTFAEGDDARIVGALQSGGAAGGGLAGSYPNPTLAPVAIPYTTNTRSISDRFADKYVNVKDFGARAGWIQFVGSIAGTTLTVVSISAYGGGEGVGSTLENPVFEAGMIINTSGVSAITTVVSQTTGTTGGVGTYQLSKNNGTIAQKTMRSYLDNSLPIQRAIYYASSGNDGSAEAMSLTFSDMISGGYLGFPYERIYSIKNSPNPYSGRIVFFPSGKYMVSRPIVIGPYTKILGSGEGGTFILQPAGATFNTIENVGYTIWRRAGEDKQGLGNIVNAGSFVVNETYKIESSGNTNFTLVGAANNNVGTQFVASGIGSGSGTAKIVVPTSVVWQQVARFDQFSRIEGLRLDGHDRSFDHPRDNLTAKTWIPAAGTVETHTVCTCVQGQKVITVVGGRFPSLGIGAKIRFRNYPDVYTIEKINSGTSQVTVAESLQVTLTNPNDNHLLYGAPAQNGIVIGGGENTRISHSMCNIFAGAGIWIWGGSPSCVIDNCMNNGNDVAYKIDNAPTLLLKPSGDANNCFIEAGSYGYVGFFTAIDIKHEEPRISWDQNGSYAKMWAYSNPTLFRSMFKITTAGIGSSHPIQIIGGSINLPESAGRSSTSPKTLIDFESKEGGGTPLQVNMNGLRYSGSQNFLFTERGLTTGRINTRAKYSANTNSYGGLVTLGGNVPFFDFYNYLPSFDGPSSNLELMGVHNNIATQNALSLPEFNAGIMLHKRERKLLSTATFTRTEGSAPATVTVTYQHSTNATALKIGQWYKITTSGNTDWVDCGAPDNNTGRIFVCVKVGIGTGVADEIHGICVGDFVYLQNFTNMTGSGNLAQAPQTTSSEYLRTGQYNGLFRVLTASDTQFTIEVADSGATAATCTITTYARSYFHGLEKNNHIFEMSGPLGNSSDLYKAFTIYDSHKRHLAGLRVATANEGDWWANKSLNMGGTIDSPASRILHGTGIPEVSAPNGSIFLRTDGATDTTLYIRAGGAWTALTST